MVASVACDVPQGSVLGPLYYILSTLDVFKIITQHGFRIHGYADDLQIYDIATVLDRGSYVSAKYRAFGHLLSDSMN